MNSEIDYSKSKTEFDKIGFDFKDSQRLKKIWKRFSQIYKVLKKKDLIGHFETELHKIKVNISHSDYEFIEKLQEEKKYYEKLKEKIQNLSEDNFKILEKDYERELNIFKEEEEKKEIILPKDNKLISDFSKELAKILKNKKTLFLRTELKEPVEIREIDSVESISPIKPNRFITHIEKFFKPVIEIQTKYGVVYSKKSISSELANTTLQSDDFQSQLPILRDIKSFQAPFLYENELVLHKEGYDERFKSFLSYGSPKISNPKMSLEEAKEIIDYIYSEFCFKTPQDKIHAIAYLITPFVKGLFPKLNNRTPLTIFEANRERAGKDYCAGIKQIVFDGFSSEESPISTGEKGGNSNDELRKKITSALISGRKGLHFGNNKGYLNNSVLESLVTTPFYRDRILGKNEEVIFPNILELSISGNSGMTYTADIANRSRFVRLFLDIENANERKFENPNLHKWVFDNREKILSALYSLVRNWIQKNKPKGKIPFSSFPEWASIVGGIMECAGYDSPCKPDKESLLIGGDIETNDMKRLFEICHELKGEEWIKKNQIVKIVETSGEDIFAYLDFSKKSDQTKFGMKLNKFVGRILSDIRLILKDENKKGNRREFKFSIYSKDVNPVNPVNLLEPKKANNNIGNNSSINVNEVIKVNNLDKKLCESCSKSTKNQVNGVFVCENCAKEIPKEMMND